MEILKDFSLAPGSSQYCLTIGNFDGVHLGHRELLNSLINEGKKRGIATAVVTFIPHPAQVLQGTYEKLLINSFEERRELFGKIGLDYLVELDFNREFSNLTPQQFMERYILVRDVRKIRLGHDFAFGANKQGGHDFIKAKCQELGIDLSVQEAFKLRMDGKDVTISSSKIRENIQNGRMLEANRLLGRPFYSRGPVVRGFGRGKGIGFPTANIALNPSLIYPQNGVYATTTEYKNQMFNSITNVGLNPTFQQGQNLPRLTIETNIFGFDRDIYGEEIKVFFRQKIREEKKFNSIPELVAQIQQDVAVAKGHLDT